MKKISTLLTVAFALCISFANAQPLDRSIRPSAAPATEIEIKDAKIFTLSNGLKVFVVEDRRAPVVYYSLRLDIKPALDRKKAGMQDTFSGVIGKATKKRTKEQLNREIDLIGAQMSSNSRGASAAVLKKYEAKMLDLLSDMVLNPVFTQEEMTLYLNILKSSLKAIGDDAGLLCRRVSPALMYGKGYPDGEVVTEETLDNITTDDLQKFHQTYFAPNVCRLVIVGDITEKDAKANAEKYFGKWKKKTVPVTNYTLPVAPEKTKVAMIEKAGTSQSAIDITYPVDLKIGAPDMLAASVMSYIFGGGASSRLFDNLREKHSYTYGVYNRLSPDEQFGTYALTSGRGAAQVKATATDSAIFNIKQEMRDMINKPISEQELANAKAYLAGSFGRSLEQASRVADFAVNIDKYKLPKDYYKTYLKRLDAITVADIQAAAKKYLRPDNAWVVVSGDKSYAEVLKQFAGDGTVQFYDENANPIAAPVSKTTDLTPEAVINNYVKALGGAAAIDKIEDYKMTSEMSMMGQKLDMTMAFKKPHYTLTMMGMGGQIVQKITFDGTKMKTSGMASSTEFTEGEEFDAMKSEATLCPDMYYVQNGYKVAVKGIEKVNGSDAYVLEVVKSKTVMLNYYDTTTGLKVKTVTTTEAAQGPVTSVVEMSNHKEVGGVKFAHTLKQSAGGMTMDITVVKIEVNAGLDNSLFE